MTGKMKTSQTSNSAQRTILPIPDRAYAGTVMYDAKSPEFSFSLDETTDVGRDTGAPVSGDYKAGDNAFNGQ